MNEYNGIGGIGKDTTKRFSNSYFKIKTYHHTYYYNMYEYGKWNG